jgi:hypothetical protein
MENNKKDAFFTYGPEYFSWCIDISFLCYIIHYLKETDLISEAILVKIIDDYFLENIGMTEMLTKDDRDTYKKNLLDFMKTFENRPAQEVIVELYKYKNSWDNYSIAMIYLTIFKTMEIPTSPILDRFSVFLKSIVLSMPDKRPTSKQSRVLFEKEFSNLSKLENKNLLRILFTESNDLVKNEKRRSNIAQSMVMDLKKEKKMYDQIR